MNTQSITKNLHTQWLGHKIHYEKSVDSTNLWAKNTVKAGITRGEVFIAGHQTAGRGLKNRPWEDSAGNNILLSLIDTVPTLPECAHHLTLLAGVALHQAVLKMDDSIPAKLKWPNDLLINSKKAGGILCEQVGNFMVVGIGLNVNGKTADFSPEVQKIATTLFQTQNKQYDLDIFIAHLLNEYEKVRVTYDNLGLEEIIREWNNRNAIVNKMVRVVEGKNEYSGVAKGLDKNGFLLVETPNGIKQIIAADLFLV